LGADTTGMEVGNRDSHQGQKEGCRRSNKVCRGSVWRKDGGAKRGKTGRQGYGRMSRVRSNKEAIMSLLESLGIEIDVITRDEFIASRIMLYSSSLTTEVIFPSEVMMTDEVDTTKHESSKGNLCLRKE